MKLAIELVLMIILGIIVVQDLKFRAISWLLIPALCVGLVAKAMLASETEHLLSNTLINIGFVLAQLLLLTVYMSIRNKRLTNIIDSYLGLGDVLFFLAMSFAFSPPAYILFYLVSMITTLICFALYRAIRKNTNPEIPLAGSMAALLLIMNLIALVKPGFQYDGPFIFNTLLVQE